MRRTDEFVPCLRQGRRKYHGSRSVSLAIRPPWREFDGSEFALIDENRFVCVLGHEIGPADQVFGLLNHQRAVRQEKRLLRHNRLLPLAVVMSGLAKSN